MAKVYRAVNIHMEQAIYDTLVLIAKQDHRTITNLLECLVIEAVQRRGGSLCLSQKKSNETSTL